MSADPQLSLQLKPVELTMVTAANRTAILYVYARDGRTLISTNQGSRESMDALAAEHYPGLPIRHIPPEPANQ